MEIPKFNLTVGSQDVVLCYYPDKDEATTLHLSEAQKREMASKWSNARPLLVAQVGELVGTEKGEIPLKVGDMVFIKNEFVHAATKLPFDEDRKWLNPIIIPSYGIVAKVTYTEQYEKDFTEAVEKVENSIKLRQERLKK